MVAVARKGCEHSPVPTSLEDCMLLVPECQILEGSTTTGLDIGIVEMFTHSIYRCIDSSCSNDQGFVGRIVKRASSTVAMKSRSKIFGVSLLGGGRCTSLFRFLFLYKEMMLETFVLAAFKVTEHHFELPSCVLPFEVASLLSKGSNH
jgi:hypothetical protein